MTLEKQAGGTKITQPHSEAIKVYEGGGAARPIGVIIFLGGALLIWSAYENIADLTFIVGVLLALFGAAIATQRQTLTLDVWRRRFFCHLIQKPWITPGSGLGEH